MTRVRALSVAALVAVACGGPQKLGGSGATCFRDDDCQAGMICVAPTEGDMNRVCSNDPTPLISEVEGPPAAGGSGGAAVAGAGGSGGSANGGATASGGYAGAATGGTGAATGGTDAATGGTDAAGTAGTPATAGSAPDGGAPP